MVEIKLKKNQTGYDVVEGYIKKYWEHHITDQYVWNAMNKSKTTGTNAGRNIGLLACNMYLKYVGKDFSMGLRTGQTYKVKVLSKDHYIWVEWGFCNVCPYDSPGSFAKNWVKP